MKLTHFGHSCVLVETGTARLLIDPGAFSAGFDDLRDLDAVLVTHQHFDHFEPERVRALLSANPRAELVVDPGTAPGAGEAGLAARVVRPGDALEVAGAAVSVVGGEHAVMDPAAEPTPNVGYLVDHGAFYHPGDSLFVPEQEVDVLGVPIGAPWLKLYEVVAFYRSVAPRAAVPIHEVLLSEIGFGLHLDRLRALGPEGAELTALPRAEAASV